MKKLSKTAICIMLVLLVLLVPIFAGAEEEAEEQVVSAYTDAEIKSWGLKTGQPFRGEELQILFPHCGQVHLMVSYLDEFTDMTGIEVDATVIPYPELLQKITTEAVSGTMDYDIISTHYTWLPGLAQYAIALDDLIARDNVDMTRFPPAYQSTTMVDGKFYGLPYRTHPFMFFYRKDLYEKYGLTPPETFEELEYNAKVLTENEPGYGMVLQLSRTAEQVVYPWLVYLWGYGEEFLDENMKPSFTSETGIAATKRFMKTLLEDGTAPPGSPTYSEYDANLSFSTGESYQLIMWWWAYANLYNPEASNLTQDQIGFANVPALKGNTPQSYAMSMPSSITTFAENKDAAWEFLKWSTSAKMDLRAVTDTSDPANANSVAAQFATLANPEVNAISNGLHKMAGEILETARTQEAFPEWVPCAERVVIALNSIASGEVGVEEAMNKAAAGIENILERAGYYK